MFISGQNNRGRNKGQQGLNVNGQRVQQKQNVRPNQAAPDQAVLQGINKLTNMFEKEMDNMKDRMSGLELKNDLVLQQNRNLADNVGRHKEAACAWKAKAEERMQKYQQALARVLQLIENNNDLRRQNEELQRQKVEFQKRMQLLVDRNKIFEDGIKVLIAEHKELREDLTQVAERSGIDGDFTTMMDQYMEEQEDDGWAEQKRNSIKTAMVLAYVVNKM